MYRNPRRVEGGWRVHWFAWRGGRAPKIGEYFGATIAEADAAAAADSAGLAARYAEARSGASTTLKTLADLARAYEASPEFKRLADSTQWEWSKKLRTIITDPVIGPTSLRALQTDAATTLLLEWRDGYAATPRKADYLIQVLSRVLSWGVGRKHLKQNALDGAETIYRSDRSKVVWTDGEVARVCAAGTPELAQAILFLRLTGFRRGDAIAVPWSAVDDAKGVIVWKPSKTRRSKVEHVAVITPQLAALLREIPRRATTILTSSRKRPWKVEGLTGSFNDARTAAEIEPGPDGKPKRLHDLRGTSATEKVAAILESEELRASHGWSRGDTAAPAHYVDAATVVALIQKRKK